MSEKTQHLVLPITGMTCANCVATVERNIKKLEGVHAASVNLASERASIEFDPSTVDQEKILERIQRAGGATVVVVGANQQCKSTVTDQRQQKQVAGPLLGTDQV